MPRLKVVFYQVTSYARIRLRVRDNRKILLRGPYLNMDSSMFGSVFSGLDTGTHFAYWLKADFYPQPKMEEALPTSWRLILSLKLDWLRLPASRGWKS